MGGAKTTAPTSRGPTRRAVPGGIQCKHRREGTVGAAVGTLDLHVLNGTGRPVHGGDAVVLVANGRITAPAVKFAQSLHLHLVDRTLLYE
ncbi:restriction endonuclease [Streptomyces sp. NPDC087908]|uniref:restriction endonuclease n=1 Tax=Streptomyces sp. NPDC087908 TaxID=3365820 RepID=UPI0038296AAB